MYIAYFIPHGNTVIRVCSDDSNDDYFKSLGAYKTEEEALNELQTDSIPDLPIPDPKQGFGEYGSTQWHINKILDCDDKKQLIDYTRGIGSDNYDKRGGLDVVKAKAIDALKAKDND